MADQSFLRRSETGTTGPSTHVRLALLSPVGAAALLLFAAALTLTSRGLFGHGRTSYIAGSADRAIAERTASSKTRVAVDRLGLGAHFQLISGVSC